MLRYILSALLLSLGILPKYNNLNMPQQVWQKVESKLEKVLPSPGWLKATPDNQIHVSPKPSVSPGNERVEVYNSKSGNVITVSEEGAEHGKPFIRCSEKPELCAPKPSPTTSPNPTGSPTPSASPIVVSPQPTVEPTVLPSPCDCWQANDAKTNGNAKNKIIPCFCLEVPPPMR